MWLALAIVLVFVIFFIIFRKQIITLFPRVESIGKNGVTFDSKQKESTSEVDPKAEAESLMQQLGNSALLLEVEKSIKEDLSKKKLLGTEGVAPLVRLLAAMSIAYVFSEVYRLIWGSQIRLLDYLNTNNGIPMETLRRFYSLGASQYPEYYKAYSFEQWLGFLRDQSLLREDAGIIRITVRGREFLVHLDRVGLSRNKAG